MPADLLKSQTHPDLILYNARIFTVDDALPWASAIALRGAHIVAVGSDERVCALAAPHTRQLDLESRLVLPGLCDAHIHMHEWAINLVRPQLAAARSQAEMLAMIKDYAATLSPSAWVVCQGWNESWWGGHEFFTAHDLDGATLPGQPCIAYRSDMHVAVANHAALARAGITRATPNPPGGLIDRDPTGAPTGVLRELAMELVKTHITPPTHPEMLELTRQVYGELREQGELQLRVNCNIAAHQLDALAELGLRSGFGDDYVRLGHVKVFADGSLGSRTAWMLAPFDTGGEAGAAESAPNYGVNVTPPEQMAQEFHRAQSLGFPISVHAIGDRANRVVLDILEETAAHVPPPVIPNRIEHVQTIDPADLPRLGTLNITASVQPIHLTDDRDLTDSYWGERGANTYAFRSLHESGARLAFGSDAPVADPNPFLGIHAALARRRPGDSRPAWYPQECLPLETILAAYTINAANAAGWAQTIGSLTPGKRADLIVLDRDIFKLATDPATVDAIAATEIELTIFDGAIVYARTTTPRPA